jgi:hypothetical protein
MIGPKFETVQKFRSCSVIPMVTGMLTRAPRPSSGQVTVRPVFILRLACAKAIVSWRLYYFFMLHISN